MNEGTILSKRVIVDRCGNFKNGIFYLNNIRSFNDSYSSYSNISFTNNSVYNIQSNKLWKYFLTNNKYLNNNVLMSFAVITIRDPIEFNI